MAKDSESRAGNRKKTNTSTRNHQSSSSNKMQSRSGEKMKGGAGENIGSGHPGAGGNRSGGQGYTSQQSNVDADREGPSRQTSTAQDEKGQV